MEKKWTRVTKTEFNREIKPLEIFNPLVKNFKRGVLSVTIISAIISLILSFNLLFKNFFAGLLLFIIIFIIFFIILSISFIEIYIKLKIWYKREPLSPEMARKYYAGRAVKKAKLSLFGLFIVFLAGAALHSIDSLSLNSQITNLIKMSAYLVFSILFNRWIIIKLVKELMPRPYKKINRLLLFFIRFSEIHFFSVITIIAYIISMISLNSTLLNFILIIPIWFIERIILHYLTRGYLKKYGWNW